MLILGIGGLLHDPAAALLKDGRLVAAIEEAKLTRQAGQEGLPNRAIEACLDIAAASASELRIVALARPTGESSDSSFQLHLRSLFPNSRIVIVDHHVAHAASAFFPSPFDEARILTLDRVGDMRCGALWQAEGNDFNPIAELYAPDSPAAFYSRITALLGFRSQADEHKVQWLAMGGDPVHAEFFLEILGAGGDGLPRLDHSYFDAAQTTRGGFSDKFYSRIGFDRGADLDDESKASIAASLQAAVERIVVGMAGGAANLCLSGGLALNASLVAAVEESGCFENVWVQPAAGNAGTAVGCAFYGWHRTAQQTKREPMESLYLGPEYDREHIKQVLENCKLRFRYLMTDQEVLKTAVERLADNQIVAWFQGRTEFGARALGNRSIFASPLNPYSTENLNVYIKRREPFRKFAASVPEEVASEYFECSPSARYLTTLSRVRPEHRKTFSSALMGEDRIRVHTVRRTDNPLCWELLNAAGRQSGLPVLYNTSFNLFGEPLVNDPRGALRSFYASGIDTMFVGNFLLEK